MRQYSDNVSGCIFARHRQGARRFQRRCNFFANLVFRFFRGEKKFWRKRNDEKFEKNEKENLSVVIDPYPLAEKGIFHLVMV